MTCVTSSRPVRPRPRTSCVGTVGHHRRCRPPPAVTIIRANLPLFARRRVTVSDGFAIDTGRAPMSAYETVFVGTDRSDPSLRVVDRDAQIPAGESEKLVVATAYFPQSEDARAADVLKDEGY